MSKKHLYKTPTQSPNFNSSIHLSKQKKPPKKKNEEKTPKTTDTAVTSKPNLCEEEKKKGSEERNSKFNTVFASDSDSDADDIAQFFTKSELKLPYSKEEDELILNYVLKGENIFKASSISLWKYLELKKDQPKRTYQSLKNRFLRNIKPRIFTTFRHLVKNQETVNRILSKYPELKRTMRQKVTVTEISFPERRNKPIPISQNAGNQTSEFNGKEQSKKLPVQTEILEKVNTKESEVLQPENPPVESQPLIPSPKIFLTETHSRKVVSKNNSVVVTVVIEKRPVGKRPASESLGIYQKYLKHKKNNFIVPCSKCGKADFIGYQSDDSDTGSEGRLVIASPAKTASQESSPVRDRPDCETPAKKKRREDSVTKSPSLLKDAREEEDRTEVEASDRPKGSYCKGKNGLSCLNASQELLTDQDLVALYRNTLAFCRTLTEYDSEEEEEEEEIEKEVEAERNGVEEDPKSPVLRSSLIRHKANVESFFLNSETENATSKTADLSPRNDGEKLLFKNMMKMIEACQKQ